MTEITYWHEWPSNFSGGRSVEGIGSFFQYNNLAIDGYLGTIILFLTFLISFVITKGQNAVKGFAVASFITFIISVILVRFDMVEVWVVMTTLLMLVVGTIMARDESNAGYL